MGYEDSVYLAKLAEQAERYEGQITDCRFEGTCLCHNRDGRKHEASSI